MKRILAMLCVAMLLPVARAGVPPLTLHDLCGNATRIVRGTVTGSRVRWEGTMIVTDWTITPLEALKGAAPSPFEVKVPGGTIGKLCMRTGESPRFRVGEEVVLFLRPGVGACDVFGWFRGKYTVVAGRVREQRGVALADFLASVREELRHPSPTEEGR